MLILTLYFYSGNEYFLSSIVSCGDITIEKGGGGFIKDDSCTIAKSLLGCEASQEHENHVFLYVEVMRREVILVEHQGSPLHAVTIAHISSAHRDINNTNSRFFIIIFISINNHVKHHKMPKKASSFNRIAANYLCY